MNISSFYIADSQGNVLSKPIDEFDLGATGIKEIVQNVQVIVTTRVGTVVLDRQFGMDYTFVDSPMPIAELMIIAAFCEALTHFEPRVVFKDVAFQPSIKNPGELDCLLKIDITDREIAKTPIL